MQHSTRKENKATHTLDTPTPTHSERCMECCSLLLSPSLLQLWHDKAEAYGPIVAGGLCGAGWWFWVDAVACNPQKVPFVQVGVYTGDLRHWGWHTYVMTHTHTHTTTVHPRHCGNIGNDHDQLCSQVREWGAHVMIHTIIISLQTLKSSRSLSSLPLIMCSTNHRDDESYDPFDEGVYCRSRFWLFVSYLVSFGAIVGAVWVFLGGYATVPGVPSVWPGVAAIFQVG